MPLGIGIARIFRIVYRGQKKYRDIKLTRFWPNCGHLVSGVDPKTCTISFHHLPKCLVEMDKNFIETLKYHLHLLQQLPTKPPYSASKIGLLLTQHIADLASTEGSV